MTKEIHDLQNQMIQMETRSEERHNQQLEFNSRVTSSLESIGVAINKIDIYQAELNHVTPIVKENSDKISAIQNQQATNQTVIDELKRWRILLFGGVITVTVAFITNNLLPEKPDETKEAMVQLLEKLTSKG